MLISEQIIALKYRSEEHLNAAVIDYQGDYISANKYAFEASNKNVIQ